jgi:type I restriction enzyme, S subunit
MKKQSMQLGECAKVISGFAFKSKDFVDEGIPVLKIANIKHEHVVFDPIQYLPYEYLNINEKFNVKNGDVMICLTGSHISQPNSVVGRVAMYRHDRIALLNQRAGRIVVFDKQRLDKDYLYYYLRQEQVMHNLALNAGGSANQANISPKDVERINFPCIDITYQKSISSTLKAYDDLIQNNNRRIQLLEESARLLYKEWFVHLRFPSHEHVKITDGVPDGWSQVNLVDFANLIMGQSPKSEFYNDIGEGFPFHQGVTKYGFRFVEHQTYSTKGTRITEAGDILCSVRAPVGRLNITLDKIILGRGLAAIRAKSGYQSFLFYSLKAFFFKEDIIGSGAIYASVTKKDMENIEFLVPPLALLQEFESFAQKTDSQIINLSKQNNQLTQARDILLPRLMNGELSV